MIKRCACCGNSFEPRPQVPDQAYCSSPDCQRARKRQWQRAKLQSDSDYRINQRAAQQAWSQRRGFEVSPSIRVEGSWSTLRK